MTHHDSPVAHMYPDSFEVDMEGYEKQHQGVMTLMTLMALMTLITLITLMPNGPNNLNHHPNDPLIPQ